MILSGPADPPLLPRPRAAAHPSSLTHLVVERPRGQQSVHAELEELPGRSRGFVLRVIGQNLLYHETPVAMGSVVVMDVRRVVMCPHVQRMLHHLGWTTRAQITAPSVAQTGCHSPAVVPEQAGDQWITRIK